MNISTIASSGVDGFFAFVDEWLGRPMCSWCHSMVTCDILVAICSWLQDNGVFFKPGVIVTVAFARQISVSLLIFVSCLLIISSRILLYCVGLYILPGMLDCKFLMSLFVIVLF